MASNGNNVGNKNRFGGYAPTYSHDTVERAKQCYHEPVINY